jgi:tRNA A-37 threonylcarbamoyl transferase component Bud32
MVVTSDADLRANFRALGSTLERAGIAHGDIQNLNLVVVGTELRLIDYDGVYVPPCLGGRGTDLEADVKNSVL